VWLCEPVGTKARQLCDMQTGARAQTPRGDTVDAELRLSDALRDRDFAFMGNVEPRKGKLSLLTQTPLSEKVSASVLADQGGFDGDSATWQAAVSVGHALNDRRTLRGGVPLH
jgi:hypothetical protein